jgi:hypothetical protein
MIIVPISLRQKHPRLPPPLLLPLPPLPPPLRSLRRFRQRGPPRYLQCLMPSKIR